MAHYGITHTTAGTVVAAARDGKLLALKLLPDRARVPEAVDALHRELRMPLVHDETALAPLLSHVRDYLEGRCDTIAAQVDLSWLTPFQRAVLEETARIPRGQVLSYGEIARRVGRPRASRAVGNALNINPVPVVIPCHRVVASNGIGGFGIGLDVKRRLLALEGVVFDTA